MSFQTYTPGGSQGMIINPIVANRAPTTSDTRTSRGGAMPLGQPWVDKSQTPADIYFYRGGGTWTANQLTLNTDDTFAAASNSTASSSLAIKTYVDGIAIAGAPVATESVQGNGELSTDAEAVARTPSTGIKALFVTPSNLSAVMASPGAIGGTTPAAGTFTDLTTSGTVNIIGDAAMLIDVAGAGIDLTLSSDAGRVVINAEEAAANAVTISSAAGGLDADFALQVNIASSQNAADALRLSASAGGIDIDASGSPGEDIDILNTGGSVRIRATESATDSVVLESTAGGVQILASGAAAGEDILLTATGSSIRLVSTENAADSIVLSSSNGGIDILAPSASAGEDIDITATGSSVNITSTESATDSIKLESTTGGIDILASGAAAGEDIDIVATGSSINLTSTESDAAAIVLNASGAAGGVQIQVGTSGLLMANQADATTIDLGDIAPTVSRTTTIAGGTVVTASVTDLVEIAPDGATTNADSIKRVDVNAGGVTTGQLLTNIASGAVTSGTHTTAIATGNRAAGTMALNVMTGTGTKTMNVGNADAGTTVNIDGVLAVNNNVNANVSINDGTSTGTVTVGGTSAGAIVVNSSSTIAIGDGSAGAVTVDSGAGISIDAAGASNFSVSGATNDLDLASTGGRIILTSGEDAADSIYLRANAGTSETIRLHSDLGTGVDSIHLESDVGGITLESGLASADAVNVVATNGGFDLNAALEVNIASSQAASSAITLVASNASGGITHTGRCVYTPDAITADNSGTAASVSTVLTEISTDGDSNEDNVTLGAGVDGQMKIFSVVAVGNVADSLKITPASMIGGTKISFAASPLGLGCIMMYDSGAAGWVVVANNGGTIS